MSFHRVLLLSFVFAWTWGEVASASEPPSAAELRSLHSQYLGRLQRVRVDLVEEERIAEVPGHEASYRATREQSILQERDEQIAAAEARRASAEEIADICERAHRRIAEIDGCLRVIRLNRELSTFSTRLVDLRGRRSRCEYEDQRDLEQLIRDHDLSALNHRLNLSQSRTRIFREGSCTELNPLLSGSATVSSLAGSFDYDHELRLLGLVPEGFWAAPGISLDVRPSGVVRLCSVGEAETYELSPTIGYRVSRYERRAGQTIVYELSHESYQRIDDALLPASYGEKWRTDQIDPLRTRTTTLQSIAVNPDETPDAFATPPGVHVVDLRNATPVP